MRSTLKIVATVAVIGSFLLPAVSGAASLTAAQVSSVIGLLQSFNVDAKTIDTVQAVLTTTPPPRSSLDDEEKNELEQGRNNSGQMGKIACIRILRDLGPGSRGDDVKDLQHMLAEDAENGFVGTTTGYYGPMTMKAMMRFQLRNGIASTTIGTVGPLTRGFFERTCGKGLLKKTREGFGTTTSLQPLLNQGTSTTNQ